MVPEVLPPGMQKKLFFSKKLELLLAALGPGGSWHEDYLKSMGVNLVMSSATVPVCACMMVTYLYPLLPRFLTHTRDFLVRR